jgi:hypothetical protein
LAVVVADLVGVLAASAGPMLADRVWLMLSIRTVKDDDRRVVPSRMRQATMMSEI